MTDGHGERVSADQRRSKIADLAVAQSFVHVADLASRFGVSTVTIRGDLEALDEDGHVRRVRGGAVAVTRPRREASFVESLGARAAEKEAIAAAAAAMVQPGESVFIDVGTTASAFARALVAREDLEDIVLLTNALPTALELEAAIPRYSVIVLGGTLRPLQHSLVDPLASVLLERLHIDTAYIGCTGVTVARGVTNVNLPEAEMKRHAVRAADRTIVVADGSKIGAVSLAPVCPVADVDLLITSESAPAAVLDKLDAEGLAIQVADTA